MTLLWYSVALDAMLAALFYMWQFMAISGAGSLFIGSIWTVGVIAIIAAFVDDCTKEPIRFAAYHVPTNIAVILACVYAGHMWAGAIYLIGWVLFDCARINRHSTR